MTLVVAVIWLLTYKQIHSNTHTHTHTHTHSLTHSHTHRRAIRSRIVHEKLIKEFPPHPKFHCPVHNNPSLIPNPSQINPVHIFQPHLFMIYFKLNLIDYVMLTKNIHNFYCCTVHFDNTYVLITNKCTSLLHI